jgi:hypothetical protein
MLRALLIAMLASCTDGPVVPAESGNGCVQLNAETDLGSDLSACLVGDLELPIFCDVSEVSGSGERSVIVPCSVEGRYPCWYATPDGSCTSGYSISIVRMTPVPPATVVQAFCDVIAPAE